MTPVFAFIGMPGPMEIIIILGVLVLLFGRKLPKLAFDVGSSFKQFQAGLQVPVEQLRAEVEAEAKETERALKQEHRNTERAIHEAS